MALCQTWRITFSGSALFPVLWEIYTYQRCLSRGARSNGRILWQRAHWSGSPHQFRETSRLSILSANAHVLQEFEYHYQSACCIWCLCYFYHRHISQFHSDGLANRAPTLSRCLDPFPTPPHSLDCWCENDQDLHYSVRMTRIFTNLFGMTIPMSS